IWLHYGIIFSGCNHAYDHACHGGQCAGKTSPETKDNRDAHAGKDEDIYQVIMF
ncbi:MAG: hypothetical protein QG577_141, partial [Thermodesulfobacteriota bacterium]|nr:hypothetical protein [Thermodesulfobacteriota bacterium]